MQQKSGQLFLSVVEERSVVCVIEEWSAVFKCSKSGQLFLSVVEERLVVFKCSRRAVCCF